VVGQIPRPMKIIGIIPARYASTRFPGKPLCMINGKSMIHRVYEQASSCSLLSDLIVATDDERIEKHVNDFGGRALMTSSLIKSGTERCNEVLKMLYKKNQEQFDVVINIQGDEPFLHPLQIGQVAGCFEDREVTIATLVKKISSEEDLKNPNVVKVLLDLHSRAIYFSRVAIPYLRGKENQNWINYYKFYKHIGIYGYTPAILHEITRLTESSLEIAESLEQLRWIENGFSIWVRETEFENISIDTPDDLLKITNSQG
jgi:3-deoxy-manno-octulosonate cytidylyltransferase (CMP-KDO synthetase)